MNKPLVTIDCTRSCLFEMQNELFHLRKNTFRQAQAARLTHSSLSQVNRWNESRFQGVFYWRTCLTGDQLEERGWPIAALVGSSGQVLGRPKWLLRRSSFSVAPLPHQKFWCSLIPIYQWLFHGSRWKPVVINFSFDLSIIKRSVETFCFLNKCLWGCSHICNSE